ncbi:MAG: hypothetical protein Q8N47_04275 [Bryobacterales bacterium]|nr:hypothetical protein [Bryobacterales bacterium]
MGVAENHHADRKRPLRRIGRGLLGPVGRIGGWLLGPVGRIGRGLLGPAGRIGRGLLGPAVVALLVVGFFWKLALSDEFLWIDSPDLANQVLPWFQFQASQWHAGRFPLWDPYLWCGQPLIGQAQPGAAYPLNWILFLLPLRNGWLRLTALNWYFIGIHLLAAWLAYWLCRDRGLGRGASIFGGLAFSLSGWLGTATWPQMLNGAIWAPAVFLFLLRAIEGKRPLPSSLLSGFFLGLAWLSGHHQAPIFLTLASLLVWGWSIVRRGKMTLGLVLIFLTGLVLTSGLQTVPAIEYGRLAVRWAGMPQPTGWSEKVPYIVHQGMSLTPQGVLGLAIPGAAEKVGLFVGITILSLAAFGVMGGWREPWVRCLVAVGAFGFLIALGTYTPVHGLLYAVLPIVEKARTPAVAIFIFHFGLAILAACGIEHLLERQSTQFVRWSGLTLVGISAAVFFAGLLAHALQKDATAQSVWITVFAALAGGCLWLAFHRQAVSRGWLITGLVTMMLTELTVGGLIPILPSRHAPGRARLIDALAGSPDLVSFLRGQPRPFRVNVNDQDVPFNFGDWHGIETTGGYLASVSMNAYDSHFHTPQVERLVGARYYLAKSPQREDQRVVFEDPGGLKLFENPEVFPRTWAVHRLFVANTRLQVLDFILNKSDLLRTVAPIQNSNLSLEQCSGADQLRIVENRPGRTVIDAQLGCRGMVILSDVYFPGWQARVDGRRTGIHEVYGFLRGVVVEGGRHRIEMSYRPRSVYTGAAMPAAGAALALAAALSGLRKREQGAE